MLRKIYKGTILVVELRVSDTRLALVLDVINLSQATTHSFKLSVFGVHEEGCSFKPLEAKVVANSLKDKTLKRIKILRLQGMF